MNDPVIKELFPDKQPLSLNQIISSSSPAPEHSEAGDFIPEGNSKYSSVYLKGDYNLSYSLFHYGQSFFPTSYSRKSFLHLQCLCSVTFNKDHYTKRTNLPSFLMAQTFYGKGILKYEQKEYTLFPDDIFS